MDTVFSSKMAGGILLAIQFCQIVATVVACAQLLSDCRNSCGVCPALVRLSQQLWRVPSSGTIDQSDTFWFFEFGFWL